MQISLAPEILFHLGNFPITNSLLIQVFLTLVLLITTVVVAQNLKFIPSKLQLIIEMIYTTLYGFVLEAVNNDRYNAKKLLPFIGALFLFIILNNLFATIPILSAFNFMNENRETVSFFRAGMADYGQTLVLTLISVTIMQIVFIINFGMKEYLKQFFTFTGPIDFFIGLMNIIGELAKVLSMSFRLFGNIFAGEVLMTVILFLAPLILPLPFIALSLLSAVVQALVFTLLSATYIGANMKPSDQNKKEKLVLAEI